MSTTVRAKAMTAPDARFETIDLARRDLRPTDVLIGVAYAGICHSDIHHARADWGHTTYPIVPGHEIAGTVAAVGDQVTAHSVGDRVGVGCLVNSCRTCAACRAGEEQYCPNDVLTYNSVDLDGAPTHGGYSQQIVVDEHFVLRVPDGIPLAQAAPLMCAGITLYSPLARWGADSGRRVGILGLGGLGHLGVQLSSAMGAHTTVFDTDEAKRPDARRLGADEFVAVSTAGPTTEVEDLDLIVSTVPVPLDLDGYLKQLALGGVFVNLGVPPLPLSVQAHSLLRNRRSLTGSLIGGLTETQAMLDYCAARGVRSEVEVIGADAIDEAYDRVIKGDVRYRFVIDISTI